MGEGGGKLSHATLNLVKSARLIFDIRVGTWLKVPPPPRYNCGVFYPKMIRVNTLRDTKNLEIMNNSKNIMGSNNLRKKN